MSNNINLGEKAPKSILDKVASQTKNIYIHPCSSSPIPVAAHGSSSEKLPDTPTDEVNNRLQDSSSTQSASDSGLGHSNSISSVSSSNGNSTTRNDRQTDSKANNCLGESKNLLSIVDSSCGVSANTPTSAAPNTLRITNNDLNNNSNAKNLNQHRNQLAHAETKGISPTPLSQRGVSEAGTKKARPLVNDSKSSANDPTKLDQIPDKACSVTSFQAPSLDGKLSQTEPVATIGCNNLNLARSTTPSNLVSALKSCLKTSSPKNDFAPNKVAAHNRKVSFNQTVIVFCEEFESSSPSDQCEIPQGYEDPAQAISLDPPRSNSSESKHADTIVKQKIGARSELDLFSAIVGENPANLTDDQLFGLLENESLLDSFRLSYDDLSDDENFSKVDINSNRGYLCQSAISDSDSESSYAAKDASTLFTKDPKPSNQTPAVWREIEKKNSSKSKIFHQNVDSSKQSFSLDTSKSTENSAERKVNPEQKPQFSEQASLPARMRVSTVDNSNLRRPLTTVQQEPRVKPASINQQDGFKTTQTSQTRQPTTKSFDQKSVVAETQIQSKCIAFDPTKPQPGSSQLRLPNAKLTNKVDAQHVNRDYDLPAAKHSTSPQSSVKQTREQTSLELKTLVSQSQPACQICRAIESNRASAIDREVQCSGPTTRLPQANRSGLEEDHSVTQITQQKLHQDILPVDQPPILNPSCASCKVATLQKTNPRYGLNGFSPQPVAYQLVYVLDQNGNRVRALQLVGSTPTSVNSAIQTGRQVFVAPMGYRFANPSSLQISSNAQSHSGVQESNTVTNQPMHYEESHNSNANIEHQRFQEEQINATQAKPESQIIFSNIYKAIPQDQKQQTVYYLRQPLEPQENRQPIELINVKSFPDPHEIRRLDGLKGPATNLNIGQRPYFVSITRPPNQRDAANLMSTPGIHVPARGQVDDHDDPTFGFSSRPSVKCVSLVPGARSNGNTNYQNLANQRLPAQIVIGSQTLDRRNTGRMQQIQVVNKEGLPGTSSMSNINSTFSSSLDKTNDRSQKISTGQSQRNAPAVSNINSKEVTAQASIVFDRSKGVITNSQLATCQSMLRGQNEPFPDRNRTLSRGQNQSAQNKAEVAYSMDV